MGVLTALEIERLSRRKKAKYSLDDCLTPPPLEQPAGLQEVRQGSAAENRRLE